MDLQDCPKCGKEITTFSSSSRKYCSSCGWRSKGKPPNTPNNKVNTSSPSKLSIPTSKLNKTSSISYKGWPKKVERELKKSYGTVIFCQLVAAIIIFIGLIFCLTGIGAIAGIPIMISAVLIYLITQLVDDSRRSSILLRHLLLEQINHQTSPLSSEDPLSAEEPGT